MGIFCMCIGFGALLFSQPDPPPAAHSMRGNVSQYAAGIMEVVVSNRLAWGHIDRVYGEPIAVQDCRLLGKRGAMQVDDIGAFEVTVVDCLAAHHSSDLFDRGVILEVGYTFAAEHGFVNRGGIWASLELER